MFSRINSSVLLFSAFLFHSIPLHSQEITFYKIFWPAKTKLHLIVSDKHSEDFSGITTNQYRGDEIESLFNAMNSEGDVYCSMRRKNRQYDRTLAEKFISPAVLDRYFKTYTGSVEDLIAGCWNFFEMNDLRPDLDFVLVKKLYPNYEYDCYSVGFLQPYIMQNILSCKTLSMVDINWRILDAHYLFMKSFKLNRDAYASIAGLKLKWFALDKMNLKEQNGRVELLCRDVQQKNCNEYLENFNRSLVIPEVVTLQLTHLYRTRYSQINDLALRVFFLSNAIEEAYTNEKEFLELMQRTSDSLIIGQRAVFIHHVGGWKLFGIYEMEKTVDSFKLKTVCRDEYRSLSRSQDGIPVSYKTHFEKHVTDTKPSACSEMLRSY